MALESREEECVLIEIGGLRNVPNTDGYTFLPDGWNEVLFGTQTRCDPFIEFNKPFSKDTQFSKDVQDFKNGDEFSARALFPKNKMEDPLEIFLRDCDPFACEHPQIARLSSKLEGPSSDSSSSGNEIKVQLANPQKGVADTVVFQEGKTYTCRFEMLNTHLHLNKVPLDKAVTCTIRVTRTTVHHNVLEMIKELQDKEPGKLPAAKASHMVSIFLSRFGALSLTFGLGLLLRPVLFGTPPSAGKPSAGALAWNLAGSLFFGK